MANSIAELRAQLQLTLEDLGFYLRVSRNRVYQLEKGLDYETQEAQDKMDQLRKLIKKSGTGSSSEKWLSDKKLREEAKIWQENERKRAKVLAEELTFKYQEMCEQYEAALKVLKILERMEVHSDCTPDIHKLIQLVAPKVKKNVLKNAPLKQAQLLMRRNEVLGRAQ